MGDAAGRWRMRIRGEGGARARRKRIVRGLPELAHLVGGRRYAGLAGVDYRVNPD
jgi:hypothetical protein